MTDHSAKYPETVAMEKIHGITYTSTKVNCTAALSMLTRATALLGEDGLRILLALFAKGVDGGQFLRALGPSAFVRFAVALQDDKSFPYDLMMNVKASKLLGGDGEGGEVQGAFNDHFRGELPHMFAVCGFVLTHNFMGFTHGSLSILGQFMSAPAGTPEGGPSDSETPNEE